MRTRLTAIAFALLSASLNAHAGPGELTAVVELPVKGVFTEIVKQYEKDTGEMVALIFVKPDKVKAAVHGMDHPDIVVLSSASMEKTVAAGDADRATLRELGAVPLGVVVKAGTSAPDVSTPETLKAALSTAKSIVHSDPEGTASGRQAAAVIASLGLTDTVRGKTTVSAGANTLSPVAFGTADIGLDSVNEANETSGVTVAGIVPASLAPPVAYQAALLAEAPNTSEGRRLIEYLAGAAARTKLAARGFTKP